jgi:hydroxymethylglutaryl-CoA lyase
MAALLLTDVTLRDGLQMEAKTIPVQKKAELFHKLLGCGYARLEITSFANPKWMPQFADSEDFCQHVFTPAERTATELMAFVPNEKGLERLLRYPIPWASAFVAVSETFNQKNVNQPIGETLSALGKIIARARGEHRRVRVYVSTVFGCPYEGAIPEKKLFETLGRVIDLGPDEVALSDTIGVAVPADVDRILPRFLESYPKDQTAMHFHNTYGMALANIATAWRLGVSRFDGSTGGIGGCPYAKGATGNVASEEIAYAFFREKPGLFPFDRQAMQAALSFLQRDLGLTLHSSLAEILTKGGTWYGVH